MNVFEDIRLTHQVEYTNSVRGDIVDDVGILLSAVDALMEVVKALEKTTNNDADMRDYDKLSEAYDALPPELKEALK